MIIFPFHWYFVSAVKQHHEIMCEWIRSSIKNKLHSKFLATGLNMLNLSMWSLGLSERQKVLNHPVLFISFYHFPSCMN